MPLYAGMDWTSYRKPHRQILGAAVVAVSDLEILASVFGESRRMSGLPKDHIFHAYTDAPQIQLALLRLLVKADMTLRLGTVIYDSADGVQEIVTHLTTSDFIHRIGIDLLREFLSIYPVVKLVSDSELEGRKQETRFKKEVRALRDLGSFSHAPDLLLQLRLLFSVSKRSEIWRHRSSLNSRVKVRGDLVDIIFSVWVVYQACAWFLPAGVDSTRWYGQRGSLQ